MLSSIPTANFVRVAGLGVLISIPMYATNLLLTLSLNPSG
jgi:hypothetical protein